MKASNPLKILMLAASFLALSACAAIASVVYPLNENADRARAGAYRLDDDHASVVFGLNHFGFSEFRGRFDTLSGSLDLNTEAPETSVVTIDIDISGLHTGVSELDEKLFAANMFDVAAHPVANFTSTSITRLSENEARIDGVLTIKGVGKPITLEARFIGSGVNPLTGRQTAGFSATGVLKRSDHGLDEWLPFVGDEVALEIDVEFAEMR